MYQGDLPMKQHRFSAVSIYTAAFLSVCILVILDQYTKWLSCIYLKGKNEIILIPGALELKYLYPENKGIAFGMFQGNVAFFAILTMIMSVLIIFLLIRIPKSSYYLPLIATGVLMLSGAFGNLIDRICRGYVIDFIYFSLIDFPVFNLADFYVVCSGILLVILVGFYYKEEDISCLFSEKKKN